MSSVFDAIGNAKVSGGGVYLAPGVYPVLQIDTIKMIKTRKNEEAFVAELDILESQVKERPAGTRASWMAMLKHDAAPGNIKAILCAIIGANPDAPEADKLVAVLKAYAPNLTPQQDPGRLFGQVASVLMDERTQPAHGYLIRCEAVNVKTRAGGDFTKCMWSEVDGATQARAAELRAAAGFPAF